MTKTFWNFWHWDFIGHWLLGFKDGVFIGNTAETSLLCCALR